MKDSVHPEHKNVFSALCAAQSEMGTVVKGAVNPAFKSKYANLADVMSVIVPALTAHGIAVYHTMLRDDGHSVMRTVLHHGESDTHIDCDVPLIVGKNDMQGMKSATTYAKRIGVESLTGIAPEDDDGNAAAKAAPRDLRNAFDSKAAAGRITRKLEGATSLADLADRWRSEAETIRQIQDASADLYDELTRTKDARKTTFEENPPITEDEIPC